MNIAFEDFRESWLIRLRPFGDAPPGCWIMNGKGGAVQIALELDASLLDKGLVIGIVGNWRKLLNGAKTPDPFEVYINEGVGTGQQTGGFGWGVSPEFYNNGDRGHYGQDSNDDGQTASYAHGRVAGPVFVLGGSFPTASPTAAQNTPS